MRRPGIVIMGKLIGLIRPLVFFMVIAVMMGTAGYLCASFLTIAGAAGALMALGQPLPAIFPHTFRGIFLLLVCLGVLRGVPTTLSRNAIIISRLSFWPSSGIRYLRLCAGSVRQSWREKTGEI